MKSKNFYVYIYLDPTKPGKYNYSLDLCFLYEPFYVGKGKNKRLYDHLNEAKNSKKNNHKLNKIRKILKENQSPIIIKYITESSNTETLSIEKFLIEKIGRIDLKTGPLVNLNDGGFGTNISKSIKEKLRERQIERFKDPKEREKNKLKQIEVQNKPEVIERKRKAMLELWGGDFRKIELERRKNSDWLKNISAAATKTNKSEDHRNKVRDSIKNKLKDIEFNKEFHNRLFSEESNKKRITTMKMKYSSLESRNKHKQYYTKEVRNKLSEKSKEKWKDPNYKGNSKEYIVENIKGETILITNLKKFCSFNNISYMSVLKAIKYKNGVYKDFIFKRKEKT